MPIRPFQTSLDFQERLAELRERPAFFKSASDRVQEAAEEIYREGGGWKGSGKIYISDVAGRLGLSTDRIAGVLLLANNQGWLSLVRADLTGAMDSEKLQLSHVQAPEVGDYHFIVVDSPKRPTDLPKRPVLPRGKIGAKR